MTGVEKPGVDNAGVDNPGVENAGVENVVPSIKRENTNSFTFSKALVYSALVLRDITA